MNREIGEVFDFKGESLQVMPSIVDSCEGCFFCTHEFPCMHENNRKITGPCAGFRRIDQKDVVFVKVEDNQDTDKQPCQ